MAVRHHGAECEAQERGLVIWPLADGYPQRAPGNL
jgi:hypothetical protein